MRRVNDVDFPNHDLHHFGAQPFPGQDPVDTRSWFEIKVEQSLGLLSRVNHWVNTSALGSLFRLEGSGHPDEIKGANFSTELRAGLTTFATMAYIIAVNATNGQQASILAESGFDCHCAKPLSVSGECANEDEWALCYQEVKLDLITATAGISGFATIVFGLLTNLPIALAPGMGLNAYFTYQVVGIKGTGPINYKVALMAVFIEGWIFFALALLGLRHWLVKIIPNSIKIASGVGIGFFLTLIGLSYGSGLGAITGAISTPLAIGGCPAELLTPTGGCDTGVMTNPKLWVGVIFGGIFTAVLMAFRVKSAIVVGIIMVSILSWPRGTSLTYFPDTPEGNRRWEYFRHVVSFHPIKHTMAQQQWDLGGDTGTGHFFLALFTFLYVDIIDCTATMYSIARFCGRVRKGESDFPRSTLAYCTDAACISLGSLLGTSPVTAFIESGAGVAEGGRTGLTALATGLCFLTSLFFAPILASIPPWATGSTLVLVGCLMMRQVSLVNWKYIGDAIPAFVTMMFIPFSYSVAYGLIAGLFTYTALNSGIYIVMWASKQSILPDQYDDKEYWTVRPRGEKPWIFRVFSKERYWDMSDEEIRERELRRTGRRRERPPSADRQSQGHRDSSVQRQSEVPSSEQEKPGEGVVPGQAV
ncbi:permease family-domain-containing protein [Schizothecium vesticola]|uniref:Permease family-domain-containing protein n=1 Tax=Schizothecium vesticola TaxID=314040 RepID=A0AA40F6Y9_9PEZI|nr:permease family-domain-containing protein [Schizothecium vesticola]